MKTSTVLIIGGAVVAILFIVSRSSSTSSLLKANTSGTVGAANLGAGVGGFIKTLFSGGASSPSSTTTSTATGGGSVPVISPSGGSDYTSDADAAVIAPGDED